MHVTLELSAREGTKDIKRLRARKSLNCREGTTDKNVDVKGNSGGNSGRKECSRESLLDISYIQASCISSCISSNLEKIYKLLECW